MKVKLFIYLSLLFILAGCEAGKKFTATETLSPTLTSTVTASPTVTLTPTITLIPTLTLTPAPTSGPSGPENFSPDLNPLTGLPVPDISLLKLAPALVSITNAPVTARPQMGLSYASWVYEFYIGEGATRFLAVFYGLLPPESDAKGNPVEVGPIRSGRLHYETLRRFYSGFLVFASASERVRKFLDEFLIIQNPNIEDINGASITVKRMIEVGSKTVEDLDEPNLTGLRFDPALPTGGKDAKKLWVPFNYAAQVFWRYEPKLGGYTRRQDTGDNTPLVQATDRLTGKPLVFENVVVLYTNYVRYTDTYFNIDFKYIHRWPALLLRDGKMYEVYWTTRSEAYEIKTGRLRPIRIIDVDGKAFPLKPGQTWVEVLQLYAPYYEVPDTKVYHQLMQNRQLGSGVWAAFFQPPDFVPEPTDTP